VELVAGRTYALRVEFIKNTRDNFALIRLLFAFEPTPENDQRLSQATELAAKSDVAIVCIGMPEGYESEGHDRPDIELPGSQVELIRAVVKANPKTVVVLNAGAPVSMPWVDEVPAVVHTLYPGMEGGAALARILLGEVNPSGKLTVTYPKRLEDTPAFNNYPGQKEVLYGEGIFVGYRHYDLRDVEPLFPFGHGLSYTSFEYSDLKITSPLKRGARPSTSLHSAQDTRAAQIAVTVKNTGPLKGKEVVQLYVSDKHSSLPRPPKELKGFAKIALDPGKSTTIKFDLDERAFSFYDPDRKQWVMEPGEFEILVGSSSRDIRARVVMKVE
jgi:beta-glucosidase